MKYVFLLFLQCRSVYDVKLILSTFLRNMSQCCLCCSRTETNVGFGLIKCCHTSSFVCTSWDEEDSKQLAISFASQLQIVVPIQCNVLEVEPPILYIVLLILFYVSFSKSRDSSPSSWLLHTRHPVFWLAPLMPTLSASHLILLYKHPVFFFFFSRPILIKYWLWNIHVSLPRANQTGGEWGRIEANTCAAAWPT